MKKKKVKKYHIFRRIILLILLVILISSSFILKEGYDMYKEAINTTPLTVKVEKLKSIKNYTPLEQIPDGFKNAVIAVEDHRFYEHPGIDLIAIVRSTLINIQDMNLTQGR